MDNESSTDKGWQEHRGYKICPHMNCYQYHLKLKYAYPRAQGWYNSDHIITEIDGVYYDQWGTTRKEDWDLEFMPITEWSHEQLEQQFYGSNKLDSANVEDS